MRYHVTSPGQKEPKPVEVEPLGPSRYAVTLDGVRHEVDAATPEPGALSLILDGEAYGIEVEEQGEQTRVVVRGEVYALDVADERKLRLRGSSKSGSLEGKQQLRAPMPGKVVKLLAKVGDAVVAGQGLVVVEAMKMENELKSPKAGTLVELSAREGQAVEAGTPLAVVE